MKRKIEIDYWWKCDQLGEGVEIPQELAEALEDSAERRIFRGAAEGYVSGELHASITRDVEGFVTPEDGWECRGWYEIKRENG